MGILVIPEALELEYESKIYELEKEMKMSYVTRIERRGEERGLQQGLEKGRQEVAKNLLAEGVPLDLIKKVTKLSDLALVQLEKT